jgi:uncharacterized membrane protein
MFWNVLFGMLFFVPFFGMAIGAGLGALMGKVTKSGIDEALSSGGTVLKSSLSKQAEAALQEALHGSPASASVARRSVVGIVKLPAVPKSDAPPRSGPDRYKNVHCCS